MSDDNRQTPTPRPKRRLKLRAVAEVSWRDVLATWGLIVVASIAAVFITLNFIRPAPPLHLKIASGPANSNFTRVANKYREIFARDGIDLQVVTTRGSADNLESLATGKVDVALVQAGVTLDKGAEKLVSLGTMFRQPLSVFYRSDAPKTRLSELKGSRIAIGREGSGTRFLALALLKGNGIEPGADTTLLDLEGEAARTALMEGQVDAIFLSGDSASIATLRELLHADGLRLYDFTSQWQAYERRYRYLAHFELPNGAFDLGENLPAQPITLLAPMVELLAHSNLHPALSDLLIEAAREVHGGGTLMQNPGEFPHPVERGYPMSEVAVRYYKSGKGLAYRYLPFWLASLVNRTAVLIVPLLVVLIPGLRFAPELYGWRIKRRIYKRYGELMALERAALEPNTPEQRTALAARLDEIEKSIIGIKIPGAFADQIYVLRRHIKFVRDSLFANAQGPDVDDEVTIR
ncbi:MAG: C4-dicarboxylate transporter substrate-binding protein [Panacagrimonas sp.]|nr:TAXI family TRAP transporter solute-binding subunit [Panacagrimonas sp.]MCC2655777.1 C4-dicarboxylate transporter substrate-binding protein [Panacagrimonas sp.]